MAIPLALNEIRARAAAFVRDWADARGDERQEAQSFVRDLLAVFGVTETRAAFYEKRVKRAASGTQGYIDALVPGVALIEMKSAGKDLVAAERQALDYVNGLTEAETPRYILTCDFMRFRLLDLLAFGSVVEPEFDGAASSDEERSKPPRADLGAQPSAYPADTFTFPLADLPKHAERLAFFAGYAPKATAAEQEAASVKAARLMAGLYEELEGSGYDEHEACVFLVRTLFCLYSDDAGVWERDLFFQYVHDRTSEDGTDLGMRLAMLYQALDRPPEKRQAHDDELVLRFPYVNGDIFSDQIAIPAFSKSMRERLLECCLFNWAAISPAVFGSLFQAVKSKEARRTLGEHYTSEKLILRLIGPMFLDGLRARFDAATHDAAKLRALLRDLEQMRFLDPACGCGNFLVIAYRELRQLNLDILLRLQELQAKGAGGRTSATAYAATLMFDESDLAIHLGQFSGIEIEEWPARIAATALHLADHQANQAMELALGRGPETLPLTSNDSILVANALRVDWADVTGPTMNLYVFGNPPFVGQYTKGADQTADMKLVWGKQYDGYLDYVTAWFAKAVETFEHPYMDGEFAFVSTNSITQGQPVPALFGFLFEHGWRIKFAHRTFAWTSEAPGAAAVHCVITGFDRTAIPRRPGRWSTEQSERSSKPSRTPAPRLFDYPIVKSDPVEVPVRDQINGYLIDGPNVLVEKRSKPLSTALPPVVYGSKPADGGNLTFGTDAVSVVRDDAVAARYLRPFIGARELLHGEARWCLWMTDLDTADLARSAILRVRVEAVRVFRAASAKASTREAARTAHLFTERRQPTVSYVAIPRHASEKYPYYPTAHLGPAVVNGDANFTAEDPNGFAFAIISSSAFITWQRAVGGRIKSDLRFSNTLTWNTFPLPEVSLDDRAAIIASGQAVLTARAEIEQRAVEVGRAEPSLADLYNPLAMDPALLKAHATLDRAVDAAFGLKSPTDTDRLAALFAVYQSLTNTGTVPSQQSSHGDSM